MIPNAHAGTEQTVSEQVLGLFPGVVLHLCCRGTVLRAWGAKQAELLGSEPHPGQALYQLLGLGSDDPDAIMLQMWLAGVEGTDADGWEMYADDAVTRAAGTSGDQLAICYAPLYQGGQVASFIAYVQIAPDGIIEEISAAAPAVPALATPEETAEEAAAVETFWSDARAILAECEASASRVAIDPHAKHAIHKLFRSLHTLKGNARSLGLKELTTTAHAAEDHMATVREQEGPVTPEQVNDIRANLELLRALMGASTEQEETKEGAPIALVRAATALAAVDTAVTRQSVPEFAAGLTELKAAIAPLEIPPLSAAVAQLESDASAGQPIGHLIRALDNELSRLCVHAEELHKCPLPQHFLREFGTAMEEALTLYQQLTECAELDAWGVGELQLAIAAVHANSVSLGVASVRDLVDQAVQAAAVAACEPQKLPEVGGTLRRLYQALMELRPLEKILATRGTVDALGLFLDEARPLQFELEHGVQIWTVRLRNLRVVADLISRTHLYYAAARRFGLRELGGLVIALARLLQTAAKAKRPQRSLVAQVEASVDDLSQHLKLYHEFATEVRSSTGGAALVARAAELGSHRDMSLEDLAAAAKRLGILSVAGALSQAGQDARARVERLLGDAAAFTVDRADSREEATASFMPAVQSLATGARAIAAQLHKQVEFDLQIQEVYLPVPRCRKLSSILMHAVRNALDHGLETPAERAATGKPPSGTIRIEVQNTSDRLVVALSDDGRGIDRDRVLQRAIARCLVDEQQASSLLDAEVHELLFQPGFSTAERVTDVSGRGVGMDAIRALAEELGGSVQLRSKAGQGSQLVIDIPA